MAARWYRGWLIDRVHPSGYWRATNYSEGYSPVVADTLAGLKLGVREAMGLNK